MQAKSCYNFFVRLIEKISAVAHKENEECIVRVGRVPVSAVVACQRVA